MINRVDYINNIKKFIDKPFIKVLTGIRRSGKSTILKLLINEIKKNGVKNEQIIYVNFESFAFSSIKSANDLYYFVSSKIIKNTKNYIFLDEVQEVKEWEKAVNSFIVDFNVDIYITGSNSHLLSSELATFIAGRYIEFPIYPLSFKEYLNFLDAKNSNTEIDLYKKFEDYLKYGGFPVLHISEYQLETAYKIVRDIYSSIILRDTIQRNNIRDIELLERVVKFVFDNIGNLFSGKNVADYFKSQNRKVDINTIYNYLSALESAFIILKAPRFDIKGKEILKTNEKYFIADTALYFSVMGYKGSAISRILENIVFLELKRRNYKVFVGKLDKTEIDFIATKENEKVYIQVAYLLSEESTVKREIAPLTAIKDNYPKYLITMDSLYKDNMHGIKCMHVADFLLIDKF